MAGKLPYWRFYTNDWFTGKIQFVDHLYKGIFMDLCAHIWNAKGSLEHDKFLHLRLKVDQQVFNKCLQVLKEYEIINEIDGFLSVKFLTKQLGKCAETSHQKSLAGKESARIRAEQSNKCSTLVQHLFPC